MSCVWLDLCSLQRKKAQEKRRRRCRWRWTALTWWICLWSRSEDVICYSPSLWFGFFFLQSLNLLSLNSYFTIHNQPESLIHFSNLHCCLSKEYTVLSAQKPRNHSLIWDKEFAHFYQIGSNDNKNNFQFCWIRPIKWYRNDFGTDMKSSGLDDTCFTNIRDNK